ncbi:hypothetical protein [Aureimonas sp. Leaf324]|uniref:hypothetical protein n=1 Tax=Aureimonas sp. Leaf324 TaxID=1736336 RepID=UPI0006FAEE00|nr:hypothetical protein [Aureimonas sp. Leaf324]KQQ83641.1 hypothetical protein ASF65_20465 [Aureimonas sp. Leaf324]
MKPVAWHVARKRLGLQPRPFALLVATGAFQRVGRRFDLVTLAANHARAVEIQKAADQQIEAIRADVARRLAALGANPYCKEA